MTRTVLALLFLSAARPAGAQGMQPNLDPRNASAGGSAAGQPIPENNRGEPIRR